MQRKIALEEHFGTEEPDMMFYEAEHFTAERWPIQRRRLLDIQDERLRTMDECGIEKAVLSLSAPGIQQIYRRDQAVDYARRLNEYIAEQVGRRPERFAAFAALPMQDPDAAVAELDRAVRDLGLVGSMIAGFSQIGDESTVVYLDDPRYEDFWAKVEDLDLPLYLHPRDPLASTSPQYDGHPWLRGSAWAFSPETATHALRLMGCGLFDRRPRLKIVLGHLGELLPLNIWRTDHRMEVAPRGISVKKTFGHYLRTNFWVTTAGQFRTPALLNTIQEMGTDHILFSVDYPFETMQDAARWFDALELSEDDMRKMAYGNAKDLMRL